MLGVAQAVSKPPAMPALACLFVWRADSMQDAPAAPAWRALVPPPPRAVGAATWALSQLWGPPSRKGQRGPGLRTLRRNPPARTWQRAVHDCAPWVLLPVSAPLNLRRRSGRLLQPWPACAAHVVSAAVWATWCQPRRRCRDCAASRPAAAFRRRRCPALRSSYSLRECSRPCLRCSVRVARIHAGERLA